MSLSNHNTSTIKELVTEIKCLEDKANHIKITVNTLCENGGVKPLYPKCIGITRALIIGPHPIFDDHEVPEYQKDLKSIEEVIKQREDRKEDRKNKIKDRPAAKDRIKIAPPKRFLSPNTLYTADFSFIYNGFFEPFIEYDKTTFLIADYIAFLFERSGGAMPKNDIAEILKRGQNHDYPDWRRPGLDLERVTSSFARSKQFKLYEYGWFFDMDKYGEDNYWNKRPPKIKKYFESL